MKLRNLAIGLTVLALASQEATFAMAACHSRLLVCRAILKCLREGVPNDIATIREGIRTHNGNMIWVGTSACKNNLGEKEGKEQFDENSGGCSDAEYYELATIATRPGNAPCD
jgi:hypothetical protein